MTVSLDARTPSASVHALSGSTPPGAGTTMQPFGIMTAAVHEMPDTFMPIGAAAADVVAGLAARRPAAVHPDAEVIDLAERVKGLAARENKASGWVGTIEDHITFKGPQHPMCDDPRPGAKGQVREMSSTDLLAILNKELRGETTPEWLNDIGERINRMRAHEAAVQAMKDRFDLVRTDRRRNRMFRRFVRWATRLTAMAPATHAGLKAKAEAQLAVDRAGNFDNWTQDLAGSVGRDAIRIITSEAEESAREAEARDGALLSLVARHKAAWAAVEAADSVWDAAQEIYDDAEPKRPAALYWRVLDRFGTPKHKEKVPGRDSYHVLYEQDDIDNIREGETPCGYYLAHPEKTLPGPMCQWIPDPQAIARKAEILAAWDAWEVERAALRDSSGLTAAGELIEKTYDALTLVHDGILAYEPRTFEGLQTKARWIASSPNPDGFAKHLLRDLCSMPPVAMVPSAQVTPSRDVVETYRTFLLMELRYLDHEVYGDPDGRRMGYFMDNPAGAFHHDAPPPSTRAATVLSALGLMPNTSAEDKHDAATRAA